MVFWIWFAGFLIYLAVTAPVILDEEAQEKNLDLRTKAIYGQMSKNSRNVIFFLSAVLASLIWPVSLVYGIAVYLTKND